MQPNFWLDPVSGVNYTVIAQAPQHLFDSVSALQNIPLSTTALRRPTRLSPRQPPSAATTHPQPQLLGNLATISHTWDPAVVSHYTVQRVMDVDCNVSGRDLGAVTSAVQGKSAIWASFRAGTQVVIRGQSQAMSTSFVTLGEGLVLAIILVYLLMVANFQSWLEPFIIMMAVPGALAGVIWMLVLTGTTINVESMMGAIMAVGVGVANGNLLITFANELREEGYGPVAAAIEAGRIRFRPIIMTALAMILGMLPMALSLGSGSEQNAPLGRAVIGGLLVATAVHPVRGAGGLFDIQPQPDRQTSARRGDRGTHAARRVSDGFKMEDDPKQYTAKPSGKLFVVGWIGAIAIIVIATAGLVLARELWIGRQTNRAWRSRPRPGRTCWSRKLAARPPTRDIKTPRDHARPGRNRNLRQGSRLHQIDSGSTRAIMFARANCSRRSSRQRPISKYATRWPHTGSRRSPTIAIRFSSARR